MLFPKLTVDGIIRRHQEILLIQRKNDPFKHQWALPGGFVEYGETTEDAVVREIQEETGLMTTIENLLGVYSDPSRDPRGHTVSVVYILNILAGDIQAGSDATQVSFFDFHNLPQLAFDHEKIINDALHRLEVNKWNVKKRTI